MLARLLKLGWPQLGRLPDVRLLVTRRESSGPLRSRPVSHGRLRRSGLCARDRTNIRTGDDPRTIGVCRIGCSSLALSSRNSR